MKTNVIEFPVKAKNRGGRPTLGSKAKNVTIYCRVTQEERKLLQDMADKNHISVSMYMRLVLGFAMAEEWTFSPETETHAISNNG